MNQVARKEPQTMPAPHNEEGAFVSMIERAARDPSVDIDKLERLLAMQERQETRRAETAFSEAMTAVQSEMRSVAADARNPQTSSKYASYMALDKAMRPIYTKHGFALSFTTGDCSTEGHILIACDVSHRSGHSRRYSVPMPADGKGAKGGDVMTKTHAVGAAMTYGQRYLLKMIFNIAIGEDTDGNAPRQVAAITQAQADALRDAIEAAGKSREQFLKLFRIEQIEDLRADLFKTAMDRVTAKAKQ